MPDSLSYEEARDELIAVVHKLETGGTTLQESIELWERGEELARICQRWLEGARGRLEAVVRSASTDPSADSATADTAAGLSPPEPATSPTPTDTAGG
ncbi:MAG: exodeoxyribonuclease VII small subunit [Propionibacteriales bacterium]|nr:exodeoxyribonuclease VII small subunit [Propionibacteriales bacterium]